MISSYRDLDQYLNSVSGNGWMDNWNIQFLITWYTWSSRDATDLVTMFDKSLLARTQNKMGFLGYDSRAHSKDKSQWDSYFSVYPQINRTCKKAKPLGRDRIFLSLCTEKRRKSSAVTVGFVTPAKNASLSFKLNINVLPAFSSCVPSPGLLRKLQEK